MSVQDLTQDGGVKKRITKEGEGEATPPQTALVSMHYTGKLANGKVFDSSRERGETFEFELGAGEVIKGWDVAVATMKKGEQAELTLKPEYAYGKHGAGDDIPPNATLTFEVELVSWQEQVSALESAEKELVETYPAVVVDRVHVLQVLHDDYEAIQEEEAKAIALLEQKYAKLYEPLYARRAQILAGQEITADEKQKALEKFPFEGALDATDVKGIPEFWLKVLKNSDFGDEMIQPHDEAPLRALKNITAEKTLDEEGNESQIKVTLEFEPNEYFENTHLSRSFDIEDDEPTTSQGTVIQWKEGKNLSVKIVEKKQRKKGGKKETRVVRKEEPQETFFNLFKDEEGEDDDDAQMNWGLVQIIKEELVPNAVNFYLGLVPKNDDEYDDEEDGEGDEDDDESN